MHTHIFEFRADQPQTQQKCSQRKCRVVSDGRLSELGILLVDSLRRNSQCQNDVGLHLSCMKRGVKTAPFQGSVVEDRMQIQRMVTGLVIVGVSAVVTICVPQIGHPVHARPGRQLTNLHQLVRLDLLAPSFNTAFVYFQSGKQNILFGVHDRQCIFQALRCVMRSVHMDMHTTAGVHNCSRMAQGSNDLLKFFHLAVLQDRRIQFNLV